jgi:hypothetical protein
MVGSELEENDSGENVLAFCGKGFSPFYLKIKQIMILFSEAALISWVQGECI